MPLNVSFLKHTYWKHGTVQREQAVHDECIRVMGCISAHVFALNVQNLILDFEHW